MSMYYVSFRCEKYNRFRVPDSNLKEITTDQYTRDLMCVKWLKVSSGQAGSKGGSKKMHA